MAPILTSDDLPALNAYFAERSAESLRYYLSYVVIDSRPQPLMWDRCIETWQVELVRPLVPAFEAMAGLTREYRGPRKFFYVIPRGHDKTSLIARLANWSIAFSRNQVGGTAAASDRDQAKLLLGAMQREIDLNPWLQSRLSAHNYVIRGPSGDVEVIAADHGGASGLRSDLIVCDEITYWRDRRLFDMLLSGAAKRPNSVLIVITNAGFLGSWQHQLLEQCRADREFWHVYEAPENTQLASWMDSREIASDRAKMSRTHARRVYDNVWTDTTDNPLLTWDVIAGCHAKCLWRHGEIPAGHKPGRIYLGYDVGRSRHLSVLSVLEEIDSVVRVRHVEVLENAPYDRQQQAIAAAVKRYQHSLVAMQIDKGGIGNQLAEWAETHYTRYCNGIACGQAWQGQAALKMQTRFQQRRIELPADPELTADLQQVEEVGITKGGLPVLRTDETAIGHADRFWSIALALDAIPEKRKSAPAMARGRLSQYA